MALEYVVGSRVDGLYDGNQDDMWYPGRIQRVDASAATAVGGGMTYQVLYDDGEVELAVAPQFLRMHVAGTLCVGTRVFGRYAGGDEWYPGKVAEVQDSGCFTIEYDDTEVETDVPLAFIKEPDEATFEPTAAEHDDDSNESADVAAAAAVDVESVSEPDQRQSRDVASSDNDGAAGTDEGMSDAAKRLRSERLQETEATSRPSSNHVADSDADYTAAAGPHETHPQRREVNEQTLSHPLIQQPLFEMERPRFHPKPKPADNESRNHPQQRQSPPPSSVATAVTGPPFETDEYASIVESIELLEKRLADAASIKAVLSTLVKQMRAFPQVTADLVHARNGERLVIAVLKFHDAHAVIQCYCFVLLRRLCFLCGKSTHYFLRNGILEFVTAAMRKFAEDAILQASACGALAVFTRVHAGLSLLLEHDVAQLVLATIVYHKTYSIHTRQVHYYACEVLLELCELGDQTTLDALCSDQVDTGLSDVSPISLLIFLLRQGLSFDDKKACCAVGTLLMCLAANNRYAAGLILRLNGLPELSTTMAKYPTESGIQKYSASASKEIALASIHKSPTAKRVKQRASDILQESGSLEALHQERLQHQAVRLTGDAASAKPQIAFVPSSGTGRSRTLGTTGKRKAAPPTVSGYSSPTTRGGTTQVAYQDPLSFSKFASPIGKAPYLPSNMTSLAAAAAPQRSSLVILDSAGGDAYGASERKQFVKEERQSLLFETYGVSGGTVKDASARMQGIKRKQLKTHLVSAAETTWATPVVSPKRLVRDEMLAGPSSSHSQAPFSSRSDIVSMGSFAPSSQRHYETMDNDDDGESTGYTADYSYHHSYAQPQQQQQTYRSELSPTGAPHRPQHHHQQQPVKKKKKKTSSSYATGYRETFQVKIESDTQLHVSKELRSPFAPPISPTQKRSKSSGKPLGGVKASVSASTRSSHSVQRTAAGAVACVRKPLKHDGATESLTAYAAKLFNDDFGSGTRDASNGSAELRGGLSGTTHALSAREQAELQERERLSFAEKLHKMIDKAKSTLAVTNVTAAELSARASSRSTGAAATSSTSSSSSKTASSKAASSRTRPAVDSVVAASEEPRAAAGSAAVVKKVRTPSDDMPRKKAGRDPAGDATSAADALLSVSSSSSSQSKASTLDARKQVGSKASLSTAKRAVGGTSSAAVAPTSVAAPKTSAGPAPSATRAARSDPTRTSSTIPKSASGAKPAAPVVSLSSSSSKTVKPTTPSTHTDTPNQEPFTDATAASGVSDAAQGISCEEVVGDAAVATFSAFAMSSCDRTTSAPSPPASVEVVAADAPVADIEQVSRLEARAESPPPEDVVASVEQPAAKSPMADLAEVHSADGVSSESVQDEATIVTTSHDVNVKQPTDADSATVVAAAMEATTELDAASACEPVESSAHTEEPLAATDQEQVDASSSPPPLASNEASGDVDADAAECLDVEPLASSDIAPTNENLKAQAPAASEPDDAEDVSEPSLPHPVESAAVSDPVVVAAAVPADSSVDDIYADEYNEFDDDGVGDEAAADALEEQFTDPDDARGAETVVLDALLSMADQATASDVGAMEMAGGESSATAAAATGEGLAAGEPTESEPAESTMLSGSRSGDNLYADNTASGFKDAASEPANARSAVPSSVHDTAPTTNLSDESDAAAESHESAAEIAAAADVEMEAVAVAELVAHDDEVLADSSAVEPEVDAVSDAPLEQPSSIPESATPESEPTIVDGAVTDKTADEATDAPPALDDEISVHAAAVDVPDASNASAPDSTGELDTGYASEATEKAGEASDEPCDRHAGPSHELERNAKSTREPDDAVASDEVPPAASDASELADSAKTSVENSISTAADTTIESDAERPVGRGADSYADDGFDFEQEEGDESASAVAAVELQEADAVGKDTAAVAPEPTVDGSSDQPDDTGAGAASREGSKPHEGEHEQTQELAATREDEPQSVSIAVDVSEPDAGGTEAPQDIAVETVFDDATAASPVEESDAPHDAEPAESTEPVITAAESAPIEPLNSVPTDEAPAEDADDYADDYADDDDTGFEDAESSSAPDASVIEKESSLATEAAERVGSLATEEAEGSSTAADIEPTQPEEDVPAADSIDPESPSEESFVPVGDEVADPPASNDAAEPLANVAAGEDVAEPASDGVKPALDDDAGTSDARIDTAADTDELAALALPEDTLRSFDGEIEDTSEPPVDAEVLNADVADSIAEADHRTAGEDISGQSEAVAAEAAAAGTVSSSADAVGDSHELEAQQPTNATAETPATIGEADPNCADLHATESGVVADPDAHSGDAVVSADADTSGVEANEQAPMETEGEPLQAVADSLVAEAAPAGDESSVPDTVVAEDEPSYEDDDYAGEADQADEASLSEPPESAETSTLTDNPGAKAHEAGVSVVKADLQPAVDNDAAVVLEDDVDGTVTESPVESGAVQASEPNASSNGGELPVDASDAVGGSDSAEPSSSTDLSGAQTDAHADDALETSPAAENNESVAVEAPLTSMRDDAATSDPKSATAAAPEDEYGDEYGEFDGPEGSGEVCADTGESTDVESVMADEPVVAELMENRSSVSEDETEVPAPTVNDDDSAALSDAAGGASDSATDADAPVRSDEEQLETTVPDEQSAPAAEPDIAVVLDEQQPESSSVEDAESAAAVSQGDGDDSDQPVVVANEGDEQVTTSEVEQSVLREEPSDGDALGEQKEDAGNEAEKQAGEEPNSDAVTKSSEPEEQDVVQSPESVAAENLVLNRRDGDLDVDATIDTAPEATAPEATALDATLQDDSAVSAEGDDDGKAKREQPQASVNAVDPESAQPSPPSDTELPQSQSVADLDVYDDFEADDDSGDAEPAPVFDEAAGKTTDTELDSAVAELPRTVDDAEVVEAAESGSSAPLGAIEASESPPIDAIPDSNEREPKESDEDKPRHGDSEVMLLGHDKSEVGEHVELAAEVAGAESSEREVSSKMPPDDVASGVAEQSGGTVADETPVASSGSSESPLPTSDETPSSPLEEVAAEQCDEDDTAVQAESVSTPAAVEETATELVADGDTTEGDTIELIAVGSPSDDAAPQSDRAPSPDAYDDFESEQEQPQAPENEAPPAEDEALASAASSPPATQKKTATSPSAGDDEYDDFEAEAEAVMAAIATSPSEAPPSPQPDPYDEFDAEETAPALDVSPPVTEAPSPAVGSESPAGSDAYDEFESGDESAPLEPTMPSSLESSRPTAAVVVTTAVAPPADVIVKKDGEKEAASVEDEYADEPDEYNDFDGEQDDEAEPPVVGSSTPVVGSTGSTPREVDDEGEEDDDASAVAPAVAAVASSKSAGDDNDDDDDYGAEQEEFDDEDDSAKPSAVASSSPPVVAAPTATAANNDDDAENEYENEYDDFDE